MPAERLARMHIAQMQLDERDRHGRERIAQRDAGMAVAARVDQDERGAVLRRRLHAVDQRVLGIGLQCRQFMAGRGRRTGQVGVDFGQGRTPVNLRLARAEQVQIGAVQNQDLGHEQAA